MLAYMEAVHGATLETLQGLSSDDLDTVPDPGHGQQTTGVTFRHLITHNNNHHGQMDFLRGLQETGWDLLPGTGKVQP